ncbi:MAG TPA: FAD-dependent oxidoreductase [Candidatus Latescibacteria bacterium]|nr:FAD-dependent oxidoreductase [Candidatus Latescibacterota bacterium]
MPTTADIVICGAGIVGVAAAYHLVVRQGIKKVVLVDENEPLSLTSARGTEAYRNWWPGPDATMFRFMQRSIDWLEILATESDNAGSMNQRGYVHLTADPDQVPVMRQQAEMISGFGAGALRIHPGAEPYRIADPEGLDHLQTGADLIFDAEQITALYPFITPDVVAMLHARRCGFIDVQPLGRWMLDRIADHGGRIIRDRITSVGVTGNRIESVTCRSGTNISTGRLVLAAGPLLKDMGALLRLDIPIIHELHGKITLEDTERIVPPDAPMIIWNDPVDLVWTEEEQTRLVSNPATRYLTEPFPVGVHFRPRFRDGKHTLLGIWTYDIAPQEPTFPPSFDPDYPEIIIRGLARMIPALSVYFGQGGDVYVDGGYYCKARDNRPLIGPLPINGAYVVGGLSGYGVMGSQAAGELLAAHVTEISLPDYAPAFVYDRFDDPTYCDRVEQWDAAMGQL